MSSLSATLSIATGALQAEQGALQATTNNIANANTPGYSRLRPVLVESEPVVIGSITYGTGVTLEQLQSLRDPILQFRIQEETQQQGQLNAFVSAMQQAQVQFTSSTSDIGTQISNFFASLSQVSADPTSIPARQGVLSAAGNLATAFNNVANSLTQQQSNLNLTVTQDVQQINGLTSQIAQLNTRISQMQGVHEDASALVDKRDVLIGQLSGLIDVSQIQSDNGITLTTSNGSALVVGGQAFSLGTQINSSGQEDVYAQNSNITSKLTSGALAGLIQVRDQKIPLLLSSLDTLAYGVETSLNSANAEGYDLNGKRAGAANGGQDLFVPPLTWRGAAANMVVGMTDPSLLGASSDGSPGSNGNVANLLAVQTQSCVNGQTPTDFYSNIVSSVGQDVSNGTAQLDSCQLILNQLQDQRNSVSGVSLNEEASNMIEYQNAYQAAARVITTINSMLETVINMGTLTG
jgi:flagellar hook-associated protein 1 FlgK